VPIACPSWGSSVVTEASQGQRKLCLKQRQTRPRDRHDRLINNSSASGEPLQAYRAQIRHNRARTASSAGVRRWKRSAWSGDLVSGRPEQIRLLAQHAQVSDRLPAIGGQHRQTDRDPSRVMRRTTQPVQPQNLNARPGQAGPIGEIGKQTRASMPARSANRSAREQLRRQREFPRMRQAPGIACFTRRGPGGGW
jgi:hypothetical protein